jgi:hypothetical protein
LRQVCSPLWRKRNEPLSERWVVSQSFRFRGGPEYVSIVSELVKGS